MAWRDRFKRTPQPFKHPQSFVIANGQVLEVDKYLRNDYIRASVASSSYLSSFGQFGLDDYTLAELFTVGLTAFVCVRTRSRMVSGLPLVVKTSGLSHEESPAHEFVEHASDLLYKIENSLCIWGKCYLLKKRNFAGLPTELEWLSPLDVRTTIVNGVITGYYHNGYGNVPVEDTIYIQDFNPLDQTNGISPYEVAFRSIRTESNIIQHAESFFLNGARPDLLLNPQGNLPPDQIKLYLEQWKANFKGSDKAHRVAILPSGEWKVTPLNANPIDLAMTELNDSVVSKIIAAFGLNPIVVGLGNASDPLSAISTFDAAWENAVQYLAIPELNMILGYINEWLGEFDDLFGAEIKIEIDLDLINASSKDNEARAQTAISLQQSQLRSINEARDYVGLKPDPALIPRTRDYLAEYNAGLITRAEVRRHMGLTVSPEDDQFIYELDPRQSGFMPLGNQFGVLPALQSFPTVTPQLPNIGLGNAPTIVPSTQRAEPNPALPAIASLVEKKRSELVLFTPEQQGELDQTAIDYGVYIDQLEPISPELQELRAWRQKQRKHSKELTRKGRLVTPVKFINHLLPDEIITLVNIGLANGLPYGEVFDAADYYLRADADIPDQPFGATPEEYSDYWHELDSLQADISQSWIEYMSKISPVLIDDPTNTDVFAEHQETLLNEWVGDLDNPGILTQIILAGMAKGNDILNKDAQAESAVVRAGGWQGVNQEVLDYVRQYGFELIRGIDDTTRQAIASLLERSIAEGWTPERLSDEIGKVLVKGGNITPEIANRARLISDTETARAYNTGAEKRWTDVGVTRARWNTVRDQIVCPICRELHGQEYEIKTGIYSKRQGKYVRNIAHPACRCFQKPVATSINYDIAASIVAGA